MGSEFLFLEWTFLFYIACISVLYCLDLDENSEM